MQVCYTYCRTTFLAAAVAILAVVKSEEVNSLRACNAFDQPLNFACPTGYAIDHISGYHDNGREDRIYCYSCQRISQNYSDCYNTGFINDWDQPVVTVCSSNQYYIAGVNSYHDNGPEDRRFEYTCCSSRQICTRNCYIVGPVNNYDGKMDYELKPGNVAVGAFSVHDNGPE